MKLALLTQYYPPEIGAPQARLSELAQHFLKSGHQVEVLTAMPNYPTGRIQPGYGRIFKNEEIKGVRVNRVFIYPSKSSKMVPRLASYLSFVASSGVAGPFVFDSPDYLFVESPPLFLGLSALYLSKLKRSRLIFNVSDLWPESAVRVGMIREDSHACRAASALEAICYKQAWLVTGQSKGILADIHRRFPDVPTYHLSNGADSSRFGSCFSTAAIRAHLGKPDDFVVIYAGLHGLAQGLDQLVQAADRLKNYPRIQFVLVGDGPQKAELMASARAKGLVNIRFLDPVPSSDVPALLASADAVAITLGMEIRGAVPSKLYEAMASERPVLLVAGGEPSEILLKHEAGYAVHPGDIEGLCANILKVAHASVEERKRVGSSGRAAVRANYDRQLIATRFITRLEEGLR